MGTQTRDPCLALGRGHDNCNKYFFSLKDGEDIKYIKCGPIDDNCTTHGSQAVECECPPHIDGCHSGPRYRTDPPKTCGSSKYENLDDHGVIFVGPADGRWLDYSHWEKNKGRLDGEDPCAALGTDRNYYDCNKYFFSLKDGDRIKYIKCGNTITPDRFKSQGLCTTWARQGARGGNGAYYCHGNY